MRAPANNWNVSVKGLLLRIEVRDSNAHHVFDDDDFAKSDECVPDEDVDVLAGRAAKFQHALGLQFKQITDRDDLSVEFDLNVEADIRQVAHLINCRGTHSEFSRSYLAFEVDRFLTQFVHGCDDTGVGLIAPLKNDQVREFSGNING